MKNSLAAPNPSRRKQFILSGLVIAIGWLAAALLYVPSAGWSTNDVTTGQHPGYPDLQPRRYDAPPEMAVQFAAAAASRIPRWKVVKTDLETLTVHTEVRTALPLFTDDVTVTVLPDGDASKVIVRSRSRVGGGDLGENARHIRALQKEMDKRLPLLP